MSFTDKDKQIFRFSLPNGDIRYKDPLLVRHSYAKVTSGKIDDLLKQQQSDMLNERILADETLVVATAKSFNLKLLDETTGEGATAEYLLSLLDEFYLFLEKKNQNTVTMPCGLQSGESVATSLTTDGSASTST